MKKSKNWMEKPITWGGYIKLSTICGIIGVICGLIEVVIFTEPAWWTTLKQFMRKIFGKR